jgi:hypothetical protein
MSEKKKVDGWRRCRGVNWWILAMLLGTIGCSSLRLRATVSSERQPVAEASVYMSCPQVLSGSGVSRFGKTDAEGTLRFEEPAAGRWIHDGCDLLVKAPGFCDARIAVEDACVARSGNRCVQVVLTVDMVHSSNPRGC